MELKETIEYVKKSCEIEGFGGDITDDMVLDCATRIYISNNISLEVNKKRDEHFKAYHEKKIEELNSRKKESDQPRATDKQIAYLIQLGYKGDVDSLNIKEAKHLIQEFKDKK